MQDPVSAAAMRSIPVEFEIRSFYDSQDHGTKKSRSNKIVPPDVQLVCKGCTPTLKEANNSISVGVLRIEPHSGRSVTEERRR
jgi:hypothetical protein